MLDGESVYSLYIVRQGWGGRGRRSANQVKAVEAGQEMIRKVV